MKTHGSFSGKCRELRIVSNISHITVSSLCEILDWRYCVLWLRYLLSSFRGSKENEEGKVWRSDSSHLPLRWKRAKQESSSRSLRRSRSVPSSQSGHTKKAQKLYTDYTPVACIMNNTVFSQARTWNACLWFKMSWVAASFVRMRIVCYPVSRVISCWSLLHFLTSGPPKHEAPPWQHDLLQDDTVHRAPLPEPIQSTSSAEEPLSQNKLREWRKLREQTLPQKQGYESILDRFRNQESHRKSQTAVGWTDDLCKHLDALAAEYHSYIATWYQTTRYEKVRAISLNCQGNTTSPIQSRGDSPEALAKRFEMIKETAEAGYTFDPILGPDRQIWQSQWQPFRRHDEPLTGHATTGPNVPYIFKHGETFCASCWARFKLE